MLSDKIASVFLGISRLGYHIIMCSPLLPYMTFQQGMSISIRKTPAYQIKGSLWSIFGDIGRLCLQARYLLAKLNPSQSHIRSTNVEDARGGQMIVTDDVPFEDFLNHLQKLAVNTD